MSIESNRSATIKDVARAANVSTATVSKFINGTQKFTEATEQRLRDAVTHLGYRADPLARSMITGRTRTVAVVILDIRNPHFTGIVKGANRKAIERGYNLLFVDTGERQSGEVGMLRDLSRRVDGLIVSSRMPDSDLSALRDLKKPVVFFGRAGGAGVHSVSADGKAAAGMLARHLMDLGHRKIAYLGYPLARWDAERKAGLTDAMLEMGLAPQYFAAEAPTLEAGEKAVSEVLMGVDRPEAVVCYNDLLAIGFMSQAQLAGIRIPEQLSVAGFDDIAFSRYTTPSLTTVDMQSEAMGELALVRLLELIEGTLVASEETLRPRLVLRNSTARK
ncbi:MAG: LacI family DNA-binding transcriptional regulator [Rhodoferax sp.]|nr:LacI family DNA-binding transcriptional regulator [Rhodoferax sp.]